MVDALMVFEDTIEAGELSVAAGRRSCVFGCFRFSGLRNGFDFPFWGWGLMGAYCGEWCIMLCVFDV